MLSYLKTKAGGGIPEAGGMVPDLELMAIPSRTSLGTETSQALLHGQR